MERKVRVRFAPSPTGPMHIGGIRTALFNYLFAQKHGGDFILRIEDTDQNRYVEGAEQYITEALEWCGIPYDEGPDRDGGFGPYRQSERLRLYKEHALELVDRDRAYLAFDSGESLDFHRKDHASKGKTFIYNWHNRLKLDNSLTRSPGEIKARMENGEPYVIRFKSPQDVTVHLEDAIRGTMSIDSNVLDDKVLFKSDGMPTYHLANIIDDRLMEVTHVIRGEEWLPSLALHKLLYDAFGWEAPEFAHLPLILKPEGKGKLSKRDGDKMGVPVFPLRWEENEGYREAGYFPEAVVNFLALLGWNPGTEQELFRMDELIQAFSLERVHKAGARFDPDKTKWYNQQYLHQKNNGELTALFLPILLDKLKSRGDDPLHQAMPALEYVEQVIGLVRERAAFVHEFWELGHYFFLPPETYAPNPLKKFWKEGTPAILSPLAEALTALHSFDPGNLEILVKGWIEKSGLSPGAVMPQLRLVLVGDLKGPALWDIMGLLGKKESLARITNAIIALA